MATRRLKARDNIVSDDETFDGASKPSSHNAGARLREPGPQPQHFPGPAAGKSKHNTVKGPTSVSITKDALQEVLKGADFLVVGDSNNPDMPCIYNVVEVAPGNKVKVVNSKWGYPVFESIKTRFDAPANNDYRPRIADGYRVPQDARVEDFQASKTLEKRMYAAREQYLRERAAALGQAELLANPDIAPGPQSVFLAPPGVVSSANPDPKATSTSSRRSTRLTAIAPPPPPFKSEAAPSKAPRGAVKFRAPPSRSLSLPPSSQALEADLHGSMQLGPVPTHHATHQNATSDKGHRGQATEVSLAAPPLPSRSLLTAAQQASLPECLQQITATQAGQAATAETLSLQDTLSDGGMATVRTAPASPKAGGAKGNQQEASAMRRTRRTAQAAGAILASDPVMKPEALPCGRKAATLLALGTPPVANAALPSLPLAVDPTATINMPAPAGHPSGLLSEPSAADLATCRPDDSNKDAGGSGAGPSRGSTALVQQPDCSLATAAPSNARVPHARKPPAAPAAQPATEAAGNGPATAAEPAGLQHKPDASESKHDQDPKEAHAAEQARDPSAGAPGKNKAAASRKAVPRSTVARFGPAAPAPAAGTLAPTTASGQAAPLLVERADGTELVPVTKRRTHKPTIGDPERTEEALARASVPAPTSTSQGPTKGSEDTHAGAAQPSLLPVVAQGADPVPTHKPHKPGRQADAAGSAALPTPALLTMDGLAPMLNNYPGIAALLKQGQAAAARVPLPDSFQGADGTDADFDDEDAPAGPSDHQRRKPPAPLASAEGLDAPGAMRAQLGRSPPGGRGTAGESADADLGLFDLGGMDPLLSDNATRWFLEEGLPFLDTDAKRLAALRGLTQWHREKVAEERARRERARTLAAQRRQADQTVAEWAAQYPHLFPPQGHSCAPAAPEPGANVTEAEALQAPAVPPAQGGSKTRKTKSTALLLDAPSLDTAPLDAPTQAPAQATKPVRRKAAKKAAALPVAHAAEEPTMTLPVMGAVPPSVQPQGPLQVPVPPKKSAARGGARGKQAKKATTDAAADDAAATDTQGGGANKTTKGGRGRGGGRKGSGGGNGGGAAGSMAPATGASDDMLYNSDIWETDVELPNHNHVFSAPFQGLFLNDSLDMALAQDLTGMGGQDLTGMGGQDLTGMGGQDLTGMGGQDLFNTGSSDYDNLGDLLGPDEP